MAELLEQIKQLSHVEQLALIREITLNLEQPEDDELTPEQLAQLEESSRAAHANPFQGSDWPTARARILAEVSTGESPGSKHPSGGLRPWVLRTRCGSRFDARFTRKTRSLNGCEAPKAAGPQTDALASGTFEIVHFHLASP